MLRPDSEGARNEITKEQSSQDEMSHVVINIPEG